MANPNAPFGFMVQKTEGKENRVTKYVKATGIIYPGDVLKLQSTGDVTVAAAGDRMIGVAAEYRASADTEIAVYDDPDCEFFAQCSADYADADVGQNANIVATTGNTTLKSSKQAVLSTFATTDTHQFKLLGLLSRGENAVGSYAIVKVRPNSHTFKNGVTGV